MSFAVKLDENLARAHVALLRSAGYDADRLDDEGLSGAEDKLVWERAPRGGFSSHSIWIFPTSAGTRRGRLTAVEPTRFQTRELLDNLRACHDGRCPTVSRWAGDELLHLRNPDREGARG
jgi:Domain of unknown function (DUF5615)